MVTAHASHQTLPLLGDQNQVLTTAPSAPAHTMPAQASTAGQGTSSLTGATILQVPCTGAVLAWGLQDKHQQGPPRPRSWAGNSPGNQQQQQQQELLQNRPAVVLAL